MEKNSITVEGITFTDPEEVRKALHEAENIKYVKEKLDMDNPRMVQEMYRKLTEEQVFETPVGKMYLKQLRDYLTRVQENSKDGLESVSAPERKQVQKAVQVRKENSAPLSGEEEMAEWYEESLEQEKQKRRAAELKQRRTEERLKSSRGMLRFSIAVNFFLLLVAIGMIVITLLDDSPNIINYENKIINQYTEWEQELNEREQRVKEREQELDL
jgi:hypothetical protein